MSSTCTKRKIQHHQERDAYTSKYTCISTEVDPQMKRSKHIQHLREKNIKDDWKKSPEESLATVSHTEEMVHVVLKKEVCTGLCEIVAVSNTLEMIHVVLKEKVCTRLYKIVAVFHTEEIVYVVPKEEVCSGLFKIVAISHTDEIVYIILKEEVCTGLF